MSMERELGCNCALQKSAVLLDRTGTSLRAILTGETSLTSLGIHDVDTRRVPRFRILLYSTVSPHIVGPTMMVPRGKRTLSGTSCLARDAAFTGIALLSPS